MVITKLRFMNFKYFFVAWQLLWTAGIASSEQGDVAGTQCKTGEIVALSCPVAGKSGKHLSVCKHPDEGAKNGYVQYHFGMLGRPPELTYPGSTTISPIQVFGYSDQSPNGWTGAYNLRFSIGNTQYTVYQFSSARYPEEEAGIFVKRTGKKPAYVQCATYSRHTQRGLPAVNLPNTTESKDDFIFGPLANQIYSVR